MRVVFSAQLPNGPPHVEEFNFFDRAIISEADWDNMTDAKRAVFINDALQVWANDLIETSYIITQGATK